MNVKLIESNGLAMVEMAIGECYDKGCYLDAEKRDKRIKNVALKNRHSSVLEFANFTFEIEASTKVLLEMTRHRMASYACKSSRYTLNKGEVVFESTGDADIDYALNGWKYVVKDFIERGKSNELTSLLLPQTYQYRWIVQFNARSLKNFIELRMANSAHFHIREVATEMYNCIPTKYQYIFDWHIKDS